jgi:hypothetical protein
MESLESKLDRLSPGQRKEAEDFVDFLLSRSGQAFTPPKAACCPPPAPGMAPPPLPLIEPIPARETRPIMVHEISGPGEPSEPAGGDEPAPFQEIGGGIPERITHDYMDYGQFESHPSPATEAVKKVKRRLIAKEGQDKPHHLLDWVD